MTSWNSWTASSEIGAESPGVPLEPRPEQVVVHGAVDLDVIVAVALAGGREGAAAAGIHLRGQAGEVIERAADRGHALDDRRADVLGGAGAPFRDDRVGGDDRDLLGDGFQGQLELQVTVLTQSQGDALDLLGLEGLHGDGDRVGAAGAHGRDVEQAILAADGRVDGAGRRVHGGDGGADDGIVVDVRDQPVEGCRRHALGRDQPGEDEAEQQDCEKCSFHGYTPPFSLLL
jgi:hypothetical protein